VTDTFIARDQARTDDHAWRHIAIIAPMAEPERPM